LNIDIELFYSSVIKNDQKLIPKLHTDFMRIPNDQNSTLTYLNNLYKREQEKGKHKCQNYLYVYSNRLIYQSHKFTVRWCVNRI